MTSARVAEACRWLALHVGIRHAGAGGGARPLATIHDRIARAGCAIDMARPVGAVEGRRSIACPGAPAIQGARMTRGAVDGPVVTRIGVDAMDFAVVTRRAVHDTTTVVGTLALDDAHVGRRAAAVANAGALGASGRWGHRAAGRTAAGSPGRARRAGRAARPSAAGCIPCGAGAGAGRVALRLCRTARGTWSAAGSAPGEVFVVVGACRHEARGDGAKPGKPIDDAVRGAHHRDADYQRPVRRESAHHESRRSVERDCRTRRAPVGRRENVFRGVRAWRW